MAPEGAVGELNGGKGTLPSAHPPISSTHSAHLSTQYTAPKSSSRLKTGFSVDSSKPVISLYEEKQKCLVEKLERRKELVAAQEFLRLEEEKKRY